jgi:hypothetical protein
MSCDMSRASRGSWQIKTTPRFPCTFALCPYTFPVPTPFPSFSCTDARIWMAVHGFGWPGPSTFIISYYARFFAGGQRLLLPWNHIASALNYIFWISADPETNICEQKGGSIKVFFFLPARFDKKWEGRPRGGNVILRYLLKVLRTGQTLFSLPTKYFEALRYTPSSTPPPHTPSPSNMHPGALPPIPSLSSHPPTLVPAP